MASLESRKPQLEIACFTPPSALRAAKAGADRVELCAGKDVGGVTPSIEDFEKIQEPLAAVGVPINVMIRPRGGDFVYTEEELLEMETCIRSFPHASGYVFGILTPSHTVDIQACKRLLALTHNRPSTFHRAFDAIPSTLMREQLTILIELGFKSILTSGGALSAVAGSDVLTSLAQQAGHKIQIIAGGGVRSTNVNLLRKTGVPWLHSSAIIDDGEEASRGEIEGLVRACTY